MLFAIVLVPIMLTIGLAIDYGHASTYKTEMQRVLDEAIFAGAHALVKSGDAKKAEEVAKRRFNATKPKLYPIELAFSADKQQGRISGEAKSSVPMTFMALAGFTKLDVTASAEASAKASQKAKKLVSKGGHRFSERQISETIYQVEQVCYQLRQMNFAGRVAQCQAVFDGTFGERLRAQLSMHGNAGGMLPAGIRMVK